MSALASKMQDARVVFLSGTGRGIVGGDMDEELQAIHEFLGDGEREGAHEAASAPKVETIDRLMKGPL
ncbi:MAG: hypothetical protein IH897_04565 [Planctomycetes bacterium]|nr:hypothetical protein [Planctomycetota bacterium]